MHHETNPPTKGFKIIVTSFKGIIVITKKEKKKELNKNPKRPTTSKVSTANSPRVKL